MTEKLTPQQKLAIDHRGGRLLISAAAGSGKTKVLVDRLISYLTDPVNPANLDDFLIITYTKAAAAELRGKISEKLTAYISEHPDNRHMQQQLQRIYLAKISTVHAFCADILREYAFHLDIPADFRIAEENEVQEIMYHVMDRLLEDAYANDMDDPSFRAFVDTQGLGRDDRQIPEIILQLYASALCHLDPEAWLNQCVEASCVSQIDDAGQSLWGDYLISDLKEYVQQQINALEKCIMKAGNTPGFEKPVMLLENTVTELHSLHACKTWDEISKHPPISYGTLTFKKEQRNSPLAEQIKAVRNYCKDNLPKKLRAFSDSSETVLHHLAQSAAATEGLVNLVRKFKDQFGKAKKARHVLDFSDIEQNTLDLLLGRHRTGVTQAADEISVRFREVMVDEYQDSNEVQDAIFHALTAKKNNCFMVGDVKQSIYQFRLADPGIFLSKYNSFLPAEDTVESGDRKILLSSNFRSSGGVISAVNDVFRNCMSPEVGGLHYTSQEMLREGVAHVALPDREVELYGIDVQEDTYQEEAHFVAQKIHTLLDGNHMVRQGDSLRPITEDDIVILLRSPGSVGGEFRYALEQWGINCTMGNDVDLLQMPEIDTLKAILQIIHNPLQDIPMIAALSSPVFGFTADDLASIRSCKRYEPFYNAVEACDLPKAAEFLSILSQLRRDARFLTVTELIHQIFLRTHMLSIYSAMPGGEDMVKNLQSFCQIASEYENTGRKDLSFFLEHLVAMEESGIRISENAPTGAVQIMSIHKTKGLEFPVVFLCGLSRGFNMADTQKQVLSHKELGIGLTCVNPVQRVRFPNIAKRAIAARISRDNISEELRVLYVAMTRARDRLIMTYAAAKLSERLQDLVLRMDMSSGELLSAHVSNPGSWILQTALRRTEAGEFFQIAGYPENVTVSEQPWSIHVVRSPQISAGIQTDTADIHSVTNEILDKMRKGLSFRYPYSTSTQIPSKLTATQLKGRLKDQEAAEFTDSAATQLRNFRMPLHNKDVSSTDYGNIHHKVLQYLKFESCGELSEIRGQLQQLVNSGILTAEQLGQVNVENIHKFFQSELGQSIRDGREVLREFKFSILEDASTYYPDVSDDKVLLQGVVDCALIDDDGITIIDFKTDYVSESTLAQKVERYMPQITTYAKALSKIYDLPIKGAYLYFLGISKSVKVI